jgi:hypothetical protein
MYSFSTPITYDAAISMDLVGLDNFTVYRSENPLSVVNNQKLIIKNSAGFGKNDP